MGTVYLARSAAGRTVALKTVHARIAADPTFRSRFRLEADAARVIGDRYGARVFAADALAATPWLATEYVIGPQLDEAVGLAGPLPEPCVRALGADLARALGQLHRSDVVHRDLKPSNVMVTAAGPKVIDFGIARALGDVRLTRTGAAAGTPAFMSPEQAGGLEHSPAGDVFALAGVLVFAASGHGPFGGGRPADLLYRVRYAGRPERRTGGAGSRTHPRSGQGPGAAAHVGRAGRAAGARRRAVRGRAAAAGARGDRPARRGRVAGAPAPAAGARRSAGHGRRRRRQRRYVAPQAARRRGRGGRFGGARGGRRAVGLARRPRR